MYLVGGSGLEKLSGFNELLVAVTRNTVRKRERNGVAVVAYLSQYF